MQRDHVLERVRSLEPALRQLGFSKLYLFGSVARGGSEPRDIDLLFVAEAPDRPGFFEICRAQDRLEERLGRAVDLVDSALLHKRVRSRVEAEMVEVYS